MTKYLHSLLTALFSLSAYYSQAQELNCTVKIDDQQITTSDRQIFTEMETEFSKFINEMKWTEDQFENEERIVCNINITLQTQLSIGQFAASVNVVAARPVFKSSYQSILINFADRDFDFEYATSQPLNFNENAYNANITSLLGFYAYMILGADYDTFEEMAGQPHYEKAWQIVNNAQQSGYKGWDQFNSVRNRYWLAENALSQSIKPMRKALHSYHLKGMDQMVDKIEDGRKEILESLKVIQQVNKERPRSIAVISFLDAKLDEIVSIMSQGDITIRREAYNILKQIDPAREGDFKAILAN